MTESGQGGAPQQGAPWGPAHPEQPPAQPEYQQPGHPAQGQPQASGQDGPAYGYPHAYPAAPGEAGHVVGPGYEGPGEPHGYGYPPLPEAVTQYIPPVPGAPAPYEHAATQYIPPVPGAPAPYEDAATQYIPPVPGAPAGQVPPIPGASAGHNEAATQYIPPVPGAPAPYEDAATQYIPPVGPGASAGHDEAATQYIPPVPAAPGAYPPGSAAVAGFDGLFRGDDSVGQTQQLPPVQEPVLRQPPPRPYPPRAQGPVPPQQTHPQPQPQYAPPPPPEATRKVSPGIIAAVVIGLAVVGLGVGALLGDGAPQNNDPGAVPSASAKSGGSAAPAGEAPVDPGRQQAVQLDKLLADSNDSRASVIKAVDDIKSCQNLDQAASDLRDAGRQREELVTRLQELKLDQLPDNARLTAALTKAWQSSAAADNSYAAWAEDVARDKGDKGDKGCKDGKAKNSDNAADGNKASGEATKAKESAATLWNNIAAKYSLTKRDKSQL
ncbi:hypothetical protein [Streptomyces sp. ISL-94]|uniref:hypothetical protein n=1 Tax=Streptomyces sp. ISL-94 TaxID=2819190 RepID=UPI001BE7269F|nr:hypothetical protein [Streptomyces sp. ISL-94]MBT2477758.1 hypothetical protein [Streptomyces sp. ISL-94]